MAGTMQRPLRAPAPAAAATSRSVPTTSRERRLVTGSRDWTDGVAIAVELARTRPALVIEGGARGADRLAAAAARRLGLAVLELCADWQHHGRQAGVLRNVRMLHEGRPTRVVAFHDDLTALSELTASIEANGVLQALTVVELPADGGGPVYGLVAGERRLTAARQVGLGEVPCLVCELDERQRTVAMLVENLQRQDLDPIEEAAGIRRLVAMDLSQREIARQLGCSQSHVSKRLALLVLPEQIRAAIGRPSDSGGITVADALELTRLADQPARIWRRPSTMAATTTSAASPARSRASFGRSGDGRRLPRRAPS